MALCREERDRVGPLLLPETAAQVRAFLWAADSLTPWAEPDILYLFSRDGDFPFPLP